MAAIEAWGATSQDHVAQLVADQRSRPLDFKTLTESLMSTVPKDPDAHVFFLSMLVATAIIELAGRPE